MRTDSLARLTRAGQQAMLAYGVTTIVDLRCPRELAAAPNPVREHHGYRHLPFMDDASVGAPSLFDTAGENYAAWLGDHAARVAAIVAGIAGSPPGGVLVHCAAGKDRTGVVVALVLAMAGVRRDAIAEDYALSRWWTDGVQEEELAAQPDAAQRAQDRRIYDPRPENILYMLDDLDRRRGGVQGYLADIGVGPETLARLRDRLL